MRLLMPGVLMPGVLMPGGPMPGVLMPGVLMPGVLMPGVPMPGVLMPGALMPGAARREHHGGSGKQCSQSEPVGDSAGFRSHGAHYASGPACAHLARGGAQDRSMNA